MSARRDSEARDSLPMCAGCGTYAPIRGCAVCSLRGAEAESRARAIRAVVAAQWSVACALFDSRGNTGGSIPPARLGDFSSWQKGTVEVVADLPTAEQIVDGTHV